MKTYKLDFSTNCFYFFSCVICIIIVCLGICLLIDTGFLKHDFIFASVLILIGLVYMTYLVKIKLELSRYRFCSVTVDKNESRFIFTTKKSENYYVSFNDVESVCMIRTEPIRAFIIWHMNIKTYKGDSYSVATTSIDGFCVDLPAKINKIVEEGNFFKTNK